MLGIAALPDAMVVPVLHDLSVARFGVSDAAAHAFMAVNLLGAVFVVFVLSCINRRLKASRIMIFAAAGSAILLGSMAVAPTWGWMLAIRCAEGGVDILLFVIPLRMIAANGHKKRYGGRIGVAFTVMFLSLAIGVGTGAAFGQHGSTSVLWASATTSVILTVIVVYLRETVDIVNTFSSAHRVGVRLLKREWIGAGLLASDRFISALVSVSLPLLLMSGFDVGPGILGIALGCMFITLALFSAPAGVLADHFGGLQMRLIASCICSIGFMGLGLMEWLPAEVILAPCLLLVGVGSAGLMPSVFSACVRREASTLVFSSLQTAGQCGYALGIIGSGVVIAAIKLPPETMFVRVFTVTGFCFMVFNVVIVLVLRSMNMRLRQTA